MKAQPTAVQRTLNFLIHCKDVLGREPQLFNSKDIAKTEGVSAGRFTYAKALGYFKMGEMGHYVCTVDAFTLDHAYELHKFENSRKAKRQGVEDATEDDKRPLSIFPLKTILAELKYRGYTGKITLKKDIEF